MSDDEEFGAVVVGCLAMLVLVPLFTAIGAVFGGALIWLVWNYAIAAAFHLATLTFIQSALIALAISFVGGCFRATINKVSKD